MHCRLARFLMRVWWDCPIAGDPRQDVGIGYSFWTRQTLQEYLFAGSWPAV